MPSLSITPGRKLSSTTSACLAMRLTSGGPAEFFRSTTSERLLRLKLIDTTDSPCCQGGPSLRPRSPEGASILNTSAPRSPSCIPHNGPAPTCAKSRTRMPARAALRPTARAPSVELETDFLQRLAPARDVAFHEGAHLLRRQVG